MKIFLLPAMAAATILAQLPTTATAQSAKTAAPKGWHLLDKQQDGVYGIGVEKTYSTLLKDKKPKKSIIVAVIDSGIDTTHEDLKPVLWKNSGEIPGNGIDDDRNGYTDDVHGWNFIGGKDGRNVEKDSYEAARVYYRFKKKYGTGTIDDTKLTAEEKNEYAIYNKAKGQIESQAREASMYVLFLSSLVEKLPAADSILKIAVGKDVYTGNELMKLKPASPEVSKAKGTMMGLFQQTQQMDNSNRILIEEVTAFYNGEKSKVDAAKNEPRQYRNDVVQDNYEDINDRFYGNNDVMGGNPSHGTHVSGIIAASRNNDIGVNGVADNVKIMTIRAVPDGDEHDKDIANAIRYAVDNGALVVNMSFGKSFSPQKKWVDDAVRYAESKGVLLVHAAGNDAKNIDLEDNFPNARYGNDPSTPATNWITVGASGPSTEELTASFSNFGKEVDVFSPGVEIYSTLPGGNQYGNQQGTSMASPVTAGIAALILSYFPDLSVKQVKAAIEGSVTKIGSSVIKPGTEEKVSLDEISKTGGVVNAYEAVKLASAMKGERVSSPVVKPKNSVKSGKKG